MRAVQDGEVDPVGGRSTVKVDIRLISATHRDLLQQVKDGKFREDLFYRLNVYPIVVPPLRDRRSDLAQLVNRFISRFGNAGANHVHGISGPAMEMLQAYDWPGNIRQLENTIFRACVLSEGDVLTEAEFPHIRAQMNGLSGLDAVEDENGNAGQPVSFDASEIESLAVRSAVAELNSAAGLLRALDERGNVRSLADVELEMIKLAIDHYDGQMSEVARRLGIGRSTLYRKLKEYGLDSDETDEDRLAG